MALENNSQTDDRAPTVDWVSWVSRVSEAIDRLGWSGRELDRRAGLKELTWANTLSRLKRNPNSRTGLTMRVVGPVTAALVNQGGISKEWLEHGAGPLVAPVNTEHPPALPSAGHQSDLATAAREALAALMVDGIDAREARRLVGDIAFSEPRRAVTALDFYRLAKLAMEEDQARPSSGKFRR
jgi:hypothetical protein